jgi:hypothetical protein
MTKTIIADLTLIILIWRLDLKRLFGHYMFHRISSLTEKRIRGCKKVIFLEPTKANIVSHFKDSAYVDRDSQMEQAPQSQSPNPRVEISLQEDISTRHDVKPPLNARHNCGLQPNSYGAVHLRTNATVADTFPARDVTNAVSSCRRA